MFPTHLKHLVLICVAASMSFADFRLVAERWISLVGDGRSRTTHSYETSGRRSLTRIFTPDTAEFAVGQVDYSYDAHGNLVRTVTIGGLDTVGVVESTYDPDGRVLSSTAFGPNGAVSHLDSFAFREGALARTWRTDAEGRLSWVRIHDSVPGRRISDTLFEPESGRGLQPTMIEVDSLDTQGRVVLETRLRRDGEDWIVDELGVLSYEAGRLVSVASYRTSIEPSNLLDSMVFAYDIQGNRTEERWFDSVRSETDLFQYSWESTTSGVRRFQMALSAMPLLAGARLELPDGAVEVQVRGLDGRRIWAANVAGLRSLVLPSRLGPHGIVTISARSKPSIRVGRAFLAR